MHLTAQYLGKAYRLQPNNPDYLGKYSRVLWEAVLFDKVGRLDQL